ncbi:MAG: DNA-binding protein [Oceanococcus sp.]|nr:MAG: DNA-binding protein [Oceanococcus sp.]
MLISGSGAFQSPVTDTDTAAGYIGLKPQTLRLWACKQCGPIQPIRIGNRLRWRWKDLHELAGGA